MQERLAVVSLLHHHLLLLGLEMPLAPTEVQHQQVLQLPLVGAADHVVVQARVPSPLRLFRLCRPCTHGSGG